MKTFDKFSEDFEKLLLKSDFGDMTKEELATLEAEGVTEEEFLNIKKTLEALESIEEEPIAPPSALKSKLMEAFDEKPRKKGLIVSFPFWITSGISIAALLAIAFFLLKPGSDYNQSAIPVAQQISEQEQADSNKSEELTENEVGNSIPEEVSIPAPLKDNLIQDIPAPAAEAIMENVDLVNVSEDIPQKAVIIREEADIATGAPPVTKEINNTRMAQADVSLFQTDSQNINTISTSATAYTFSPNSTLSNVSVQELSTISEGAVFTTKKSYSLAENPSDLKNLVTIY